MPQFTDAKGDVWRVAVTGGTVKRAAEILHVDIGEPLAGDPPLLTRFDTDIAFKVDLIYVVCLPEADKRGITDLEFAERMEGDALYEASEAFLEALTDFSRRLRREHIATAIEKQRAVVRRALDLASRTVASDEFDRTLDAELAELGESFASLLRSPAPTRSPGPSES